MVKEPTLKTRLIVYPLLAGLFLLGCYFIALLAFGYNLKIVNGRLVKEKTGTILLATRPGDAKVMLDGQIYPNKTPLLPFLFLKVDRMKPGLHSIKVEKEGFESWEGKFKVESGMVSWGNYILLLPKERKSTAYNFSEITSQLTSKDQSKIFVITKEKETSTAIFWEINSSNKEKRKLFEKELTIGEEYVPLSYSSNEERLLLEHRAGGSKSYTIFDVRENGKFWDPTSGYKDAIVAPVFNPRNQDELVILKDGSPMYINYVSERWNQGKETGITSLHPQDDEMVYVKKSNGDTGLWRFTATGNSQQIVPTLPVSERYTVTALKDHVYAVLPLKTKELIICSANSGNFGIKKIAGNVDWFLPSPESKYLAYYSAGNLETYEVEKKRYFRALEQANPKNVVWAEDDSNIFYQTDKSVKMVNFSGFYNKEIAKASEGPIVISGSYNLYYSGINQSKKTKDIFVFGFKI